MFPPNEGPNLQVYNLSRKILATTHENNAMRPELSIWPRRFETPSRAMRGGARPRPREIIEEFPTVELSEATLSAFDPLARKLKT
jgi:hypothetical protein